MVGCGATYRFFGHQIFGKGPDSSISKVSSNRALANDAFEAALTTEPYLILRNSAGCGIDVAPDIGETQDHPTPTYASLHKLYIPDRRSTNQSWQNMFDALNEYVDMSWLPTAPHMEELMDGWDKSASTFDTRDMAAVELGMIPGDLNREWPDSKRKMCLIHPFKDACLTFPNEENMRSYTEIIEIRRRSVIGGAVLLSVRLASREERARRREAHAQTQKSAKRESVDTRSAKRSRAPKRKRRRRRAER